MSIAHALDLPPTTIPSSSIEAERSNLSNFQAWKQAHSRRSMDMSTKFNRFQGHNSHRAVQHMQFKEQVDEEVDQLKERIEARLAKEGLDLNPEPVNMFVKRSNSDASSLSAQSSGGVELQQSNPAEEQDRDTNANLDSDPVRESEKTADPVMSATRPLPTPVAGPVPVCAPRALPVSKRGAATAGSTPGAIAPPRSRAHRRRHLEEKEEDT